MKRITGQFQSNNPTVDCNISIGFIPDVVELWLDVAGTPTRKVWFNKGTHPLWATAGTALSISAIGAVTADGASIEAYAGGDVAVANNMYRKRDGENYAVGDVTGAGFTVPAGDQTVGGKNFFVAYTSQVR